MKHKILAFGVLWLMCLGLNAQNDTVVLMTINGESITKRDFLKTYQKNNEITTISKSDLDEYLKLYTQFKLKVQEAKKNQLDTSVAFKSEFNSYRNQSAQYYLVDKDVNEHLINEAVEHSKWNLRASHILVRCKPEALPKDSLEAFQKIMKIRARILAGANFNDIAFEVSEDPSAQDFKNPNTQKIQPGNRGDLGYFTVFDLIYPFESAAYGLKIGEVSMPVRTDFGYHLIYLVDKVPAVSKIHASQIFVNSETPQAKEKIDLAYRNLLNGQSFEEVVKQYSEDKATAEKDGEVMPFAPSRRPGDFSKMLLNMKPGAFSEPTFFANGWYILRLNRLEHLVPDEENKAFLKNRISRDSRSYKSKDAFIKRLKTEYNYKEAGKKQAFELISKSLDSSFYQGAWQGNVPLKKDFPIITFSNEKIETGTFINYLKRYQGKGSSESLKKLMESRFNTFVDELLITYENANLPVKYPEFKDLMNEYYEGMLLYEINTDKVWGKAVKDTAGLEAFYETVKNNYIKDAQINLVTFEITPATVSTIQKLLTAGETYENIDSVIFKKFKTRVNFKEYSVGENEDSKFHNLFANLPLEKSILVSSKIGAAPDSNELIYVEKVTPRAPKKLSEVKAYIITEYQKYLEEKWLEELYKNAQIHLNNQVYESILK